MKFDCMFIQCYGQVQRNKHPQWTSLIWYFKLIMRIQLATWEPTDEVLNEKKYKCHDSLKINLCWSNLEWNMTSN